MSTSTPPPASDEPDWERRRRLDDVFGDALPDVTGDERDPDPREKESQTDEDWLRAQVPPHHG